MKTEKIDNVALHPVRWRSIMHMWQRRFNFISINSGVKRSNRVKNWQRCIGTAGKQNNNNNNNIQQATTTKSKATGYINCLIENKKIREKIALRTPSSERNCYLVDKTPPAGAFLQWRPVGKSFRIIKKETKNKSQKSNQIKIKVKTRGQRLIQR